MWTAQRWVSDSYWVSWPFVVSVAISRFPCIVSRWRLRFRPETDALRSEHATRSSGYHFDGILASAIYNTIMLISVRYRPIALSTIRLSEVRRDLMTSRNIARDHDDTWGATFMCCDVTSWLYASLSRLLTFRRSVSRWRVRYLKYITSTRDGCWVLPSEEIASQKTCKRNRDIAN